jgi:hypothetical protein
VQEKVGNPPSRTELFFSVKCIASREWQLDSPDRARPDTIELPIQLDEACGWGCRRNACYGKPCGDRLAAQVPGSPSLSTTMTRWPGNSSLAVLSASALSAAKTGITAIPSGRSAITSNSTLIVGSCRAVPASQTGGRSKRPTCNHRMGSA